MPLIALPIDPLLDEIVDRVRRSRAAVITAAPGAGKTTRVPPALVADGPVILLQPRRVAARAIAARIAEEQAWTLGREVGWQVRFERHFSAHTRLLVVTEGILTARLQTDPLLSDFTTIILDEFHERSVHADLAIALARQAWRARNSTRSGSSHASSTDDHLRIVVMSATLDAQPVSAFLDGCPVIEVPGRLHPIEVTYHPEVSIASAALDLLGATDGQMICFLPGAPEIRRAISELQQKVDRAVEVVPLHGSLPPGEQDLALRPTSSRRIIVATNIAETSLTVPGVTAVIDAGLQKVARYDAARGIDSLATERITRDAADQRAGRAGRLGPGLVRRLWDARDRLRPRREPDIHRIDLASTALDVIAWGGDPRTLEWFERPRQEALDAALTLLASLGLISLPTPQSAGGSAPRLTPIGEQVRRLPIHPRLARMLVAANGARPIARACALLSERHFLAPRTASTSSDLLSALDHWRDMPPHVQRVADEVYRNAGLSGPLDISETDFRHAVLAGYPDRVAQRREANLPNVLLASGTGATIAAESGVRGGEFLVALDVSLNPQSNPRSNPQSNPHSALRTPQFPSVRIASIVDRAWLQPTSSDLNHRFDAVAGRVRATIVDRYDALVLAERPASVDPEIAARLLADAWLARGPNAVDTTLLRRLRFAGHDVDLETMVRSAAYGVRTLDDVQIGRALTADVARDIARHAPESLAVPSGRQHPLDYREDGGVSTSVKLQELFGLAETPRVGRQHEAVVLSLLAPNGRPVQVTRDLRSFWDRTYPEVRKELRGRYPKHPWPEDPWTAPPTGRTLRRAKG